MENIVCVGCYSEIKGLEAMCNLSQSVCFKCREGFVDLYHVQDCISCKSNQDTYFKICIICQDYSETCSMLHPTNCKTHFYCKECANGRSYTISKKIPGSGLNFRLEHDCDNCKKFFKILTRPSSNSNCSFCGNVSGRSSACQKHDFCRTCLDSLRLKEYFRKFDRINDCSFCLEYFEETIRISKRCTGAGNGNENVLDTADPQDGIGSSEVTKDKLYPRNLVANELCHSCKHKKPIDFIGSCGHFYCEICFMYAVLRPTIYGFLSKFYAREAPSNTICYKCKCGEVLSNYFPINKLILRSKAIFGSFEDPKRSMGEAFSDFFERIINSAEILEKYIHYLEGAECIFFTCPSCKNFGFYAGRIGYCPNCYNYTSR